MKWFWILFTGWLVYGTLKVTPPEPGEPNPKPDSPPVLLADPPYLR